MDHRWARKQKPTANHRAQFSSWPDFFVDLLWNRGLKTSDEVERFLKPDYDRDLHAPTLLKDIKKVADRIWQAIEQKEKIMVYGDYDADGICSSVILAEFFKKLDFEHGIYMADRNREGYGLNLPAVEKFAEEGIELIVVLDNGTTNHKEISAAKEKGIDVVVVDHHQVLDKPPPADAFVNQHQSGDTYPFKGLCAGGLAFKLFQVLIDDERAGERWQDGEEKWLLDLVALATVADMMPLLDENRTLVKYGLFVLAQTKRLGLQELFKVAGITPRFDSENMQTNINSITIGFSLGPRINAASRMAHAGLAYDLIRASEPLQARSLALELEANNSRRRREIEYVYKEATANLDEENPPDFIVKSSPNWPTSVAGLIANRIKDNYVRPVMIVGEQGDDSKASLRSLSGFNLIKALESVAEHLIQYGGHKAAAGCTFKTKDFLKIKEGLNRYAAEHLTDEIKTPKLEIDTDLALADVTLENAELVDHLAPFGMANPMPRFLIENVTLEDIRMLGQKNQHAKLLFANTSTDSAQVPTHGLVPTLMFFHKGKIDRLAKGERYDIVGELSVNEWNGRREPQFKIIDIRPH